MGTPDADPQNNLQEPGTLPGFCASEARKFILAAAILASAMGFIDGTLVSIALPAMRAGLDASLTQAQWINNAYLLPLSALILLGGALGDRYGLARSFSVGIAVFVMASLVCAMAPSADILIAGRIFKGIGAAVMIPGSLAMVARAYPKAERGRAIGIWAASSAVTTAIGPILAGFALTIGGPEMWRWLFAINLPLGGLALWLLLRHVARDPSDATRPLDRPGAALVSMGLGALAWGLTAGEGRTDWVLVGIGTGMLATFLLWEARAKTPMMPLGLFSDRTFAIANLATFLVYFALGTVLFYLPMTMITAWGLSEAVTSAVFVPLTLFIGLMSGRAGGWADRYGPGRIIGIGGLCVAAAFTGLSLGIQSGSLIFGVFPATILMGFGMSLLVAPLSTAIMTSVPEERSGTASGINNALSRVAGLIAVAVMGGLGARVYAGAGGPDSFGAFSQAADHAPATLAAFSVLAGVVAALSASGAILAWVMIPAPAPRLAA